MTDTDIAYEVFEEDPPSYLNSYIMSAFVLGGILGLAAYRVPFWPLSLAHVFTVIWFGILFFWILRDARQKKLFSSQRLAITKETYKHSFRYAVAEATHVEMAVSEIVDVQVSETEPRWISVSGKHDSDMYFLPKNADPERVVEALLRANPKIRMIE